MGDESLYEIRFPVVKVCKFEATHEFFIRRYSKNIQEGIFISIADIKCMFYKFKLKLYSMEMFIVQNYNKHKVKSKVF